jgi:hypothetical protein
MFRQCHNHNQELTTYDNISDTLTKYRNKYNQQVACISIIQSERNKDFLKMKSQDRSIIELQKLVKEYKNKIKDGGGASIIHVITTKYDTIPILYKDSLIIFQDSTKWINLKGEIKNNSLAYSLKVRNEFNIIYGKEKRKEYAEITSKNPHTTTEVFRVYQKQKKQIISGGINIGIGTGYDMWHQQPYIGIGINAGLNINF